MPINEIDVEELATVRDAGGFVLDVRNADEYAEAHVPGVVLIPLDELEARYVELPVVDAIYVICRSGGRSMRAGEFLQSRGINAVNVAGGTLAWIDSGRAVESGASGE